MSIVGAVVEILDLDTKWKLKAREQAEVAALKCGPWSY